VRRKPTRIAFSSRLLRGGCHAAARQRDGRVLRIHSRRVPEIRDFRRLPGRARQAGRYGASGDRGDVKVDNEWVRSHKLALLEKYEYDYRKLLLEGSAEELAAFNYFDPAVEKQDSRISAYVQQVCGIE